MDKSRCRDISLENGCVRRKTLLSLDESRRIVADYIKCYDEVRLHSAIGYIAPKDKLEGKAEKIADERKKKWKRLKQ